jgi:peptidoglycan-N-acetylmuramic acid deacetylase
VPAWLLSAVVVAATVLGAGANVAASDPAEVIVRGPQTNTTVALTFDDGWHAGRCAEIYDTLVRFDVPATFFPNAIYMGSARKLWRQIAQRFPIANHTTHHVSLPGRSRAKIRKEIKSEERRIEKMTGQPMSKMLRPPYGAYDKRVLREAGRLGYDKVVLWDVSGNDTSRKGTDRGVARAALRGKPGSIVLMHCGPEPTARVLPIIIARYACRGFRFATVEDLLAGRPGKAARVTCPAPDLPARGKNVPLVEVADVPLVQVPLDASRGDWRLTDVGRDGALEAVSSDVVLTLHLEPMRISGVVGCDVYTARSVRPMDDVVRFDQLAASQGDCGGPDDPARAHLATLMTASRSRLADGALEMLDAEGQTTLRFAPALPHELVGRWDTTAVAGADGKLVDTAADGAMSLTFQPAAVLVAETSCDSQLAGFAASGASLAVGPRMEVSADCPDDPGSDRLRFLAALDATESWKLRAGTLKLRDANDKVVLKLVPRTVD